MSYTECWRCQTAITNGTIELLPDPYAVRIEQVLWVKAWKYHVNKPWVVDSVMIQFVHTSQRDCNFEASYGIETYWSHWRCPLVHVDNCKSVLMKYTGDMTDLLASVIKSYIISG